MTKGKSAYPSLTWRRDGQMRYLEMAGEPIVELDRDRWYRFRSRDRDMRWMYSDSVTGSSDWTEISVEFDVYGVTTTLFLEMSGTGKCWFDNVRIEDVGPMRWADVQLSELDFTKGVDRYWERHRRRTGK